MASGTVKAGVVAPVFIIVNSHATAFHSQMRMDNLGYPIIMTLRMYWLLHRQEFVLFCQYASSPIQHIADIRKPA